MNRIFITLLSIFLPCITLKAAPFSLVSTESDPDAFVQNCVNVINGDYCEVSTDLLLPGPDALIVQRYYSIDSGWKMIPERFLIVGKHPARRSCTIGKDSYDWTLALTGERSGGILPYCGWRNRDGHTKDPLRIDILNQANGVVNTYAKEMNGQTNHSNNQLHCNSDNCELTLGDGTKRFYRRVTSLPSMTFGEQITPR